MGQNKEQLNKLLAFIEQLTKQQGNEWFVDKLRYITGDNRNINSFDAFVRLQRNKCMSISRRYYKNIKSDVLRKQLVHEHSMMLWYKSIREIGQYFVYVNHQIENMLNTYCSSMNAHEKIQQRPELYVKHLENKSFKLNINCYSYFFNQEKDYERNPIPKITSLYAKLVFWAVDSDNCTSLSKNFGNFISIVNIRNEESHSDATQEKRSLKYMQNQEDDTQYSFIEAVLKKVRDSLIAKNI